MKQVRILFPILLFGLLIISTDYLLAQDGENRSSRRNRLIKAFDRNKDGKLDNTEKKAIREYLERRVNKESALPTNRKDEIRVPDNYNKKKKYYNRASFLGHGCVIPFSTASFNS